MEQKAGGLVTLSPSVGPLSSFRLLLLGPFLLLCEGEPVDTTRWQRRLGSFLKLLATAPGRRLSRDAIVEALWPEATPKAGHSDFRYLLHLLRRNLGGTDPPALLSERGWVWLNPQYGWDIDLDRFELGIRTCGDDVDLLEEAAALFRGEPLIENRYDDWAVPVRNRLQREWRNLCIRLGRLHRDRGALYRSVHWLESALDADPLDEEALEELLRCLMEMERLTDALRRYSEYERLLRDEMGVAPAPRLRSMVEDLLARCDGPSPSPERSPADVMVDLVPVVPRCLPRPQAPFVGREMELAHVLALLREESPNGPRLLLLSGDTGIGKTRILAEAAHQCLEARMVTLGGRCYEQEGRIAYAPIHDALLDYISTQPISLLHAQLDGLPGTIAAIIPEVRSRLRFGDERQPAQTADQRLYLFVAVGQLLERIGQNRPLALFLDDLQWADESSIQLVHFLLRQDRLRCLRLIGAYRADELAPDAPLTKLIGPPGQSDGIDELTLHPFSRTALISLIEAELSARCSGGLVAVLERKSGGNPFFVL